MNSQFQQTTNNLSGLKAGLRAHMGDSLREDQSDLFLRAFQLFPVGPGGDPDVLSAHPLYRRRGSSWAAERSSLQG
jgi:hypothetical protein